MIMCEIYFISEKNFKFVNNFWKYNLFQNNDTVTNLDLEDDGIEAEGAKAIAEMLEINTNIVDVVSILSSTNQCYAVVTFI